MKHKLGPGFRGFAMALAAACMAGCVLDEYTGPAITLTGGYDGFTFGVELKGRPRKPPEPLAEAAAILSIEGEPLGAKQPISGK